MNANYEYSDGKVIEKATGWVVYLTKNRKCGIKMTNWLNAGGGFNGHTPFFFVRELNK